MCSQNIATCPCLQAPALKTHQKQEKDVSLDDIRTPLAALKSGGLIMLYVNALAFVIP